MEREPETLQEAILYFANSVNCRNYLVARRWPNGVVACPRCGSTTVVFSEKHNRWQCGSHHDRRQFTSKTGTIFEESHISLNKWLLAMWQVVNCKNGISSYEIARATGVTQKTAWFMDHRIRLALGMELSTKKFSGEVEADETYVGGKAEFTHLDKRTKPYAREAVHTNGLENFSSLMKRSLKGTYVSVEPFHLQAFADQRAFRFNNRKLTGAERFDIAGKGIVGKRLTFNELTGKTDSTTWRN